MGRRNRKNPQQKPKLDINFNQVFENEAIKNYYRLQLNLDSADLDAMFEQFKIPLPTSLRVNIANPLLPKVLEKLHQHTSECIEDEGKVLPKLLQVPWFPQGNVWNLNLTRQYLKRNPDSKDLHNFIITCTDVGVITRQELVSMIPPVLLQISPGMSILDTCAAPGSKTEQIIELLNNQGVVVANEIDRKRAHKLIHQLQRSRTEAMIVTNYEAQSFPSIGDQYFDRILCDVPCSGDGTLRKSPTKWVKWNIKDGFSLHPTQCKILERAIELCKEDGYICYSTCTPNPIEDEAVINWALSNFGEFVELVDLNEYLPQLLPGLKFRKGLRKWKVLDKGEGFNYVEFDSYENVPEDKRYIKESMFCVKENELLEKTARILPQDQDTGGFFVALFKRLNGEQKRRFIDSRKGHFPSSLPNFTQLDPNSPDIRNFHEYYGVFGFPIENVFSPSSTKIKNLNIVTAQATQIFQAAPRLKIVNMGAKLITENSFKFIKDCKYRINYESIHLIFPYLSRNVIQTRDMEFFNMITQELFVSEININDTNVIQQMPSQGFYVIQFVGDNLEEVVTVQKLGPERITPMVPKDYLKLLRAIYFS